MGLSAFQVGAPATATKRVHNAVGIESEIRVFKFIFLGLLTTLPACATLVNGSSQSVTVSTTPPAATCTLDRMGMRVGAVAITPGSVHVDKSKNDLSVTCTKDGFVAATVSKSPSFGGATFGNIIAGGVIGVIVDAASGANYTYPDEIKVDLAAMPPATVQPLASQASPALILPVVDIAAPVAIYARPVPELSEGTIQHAVVR